MLRSSSSSSSNKSQWCVVVRVISLSNLFLSDLWLPVLYSCAPPLFNVGNGVVMMVMVVVVVVVVIVIQRMAMMMLFYILHFTSSFIHIGVFFFPFPIDIKNII